MIFLWNLAFFLATQILYILVFYIIVIYCHELFQLYFITCKHVVSYAYYPSMSLTPFIPVVMQTCKLWVWKFWYMLLLCMFCLLFDYLNEMKCMLYTIFVKLTPILSWKHIGTHRYANPLFLDECFLWYDCLVMNIMLFTLKLYHLCFICNLNQAINCHTSLNLVSKDLFRA